MPRPARLEKESFPELIDKLGALGSMQWPRQSPQWRPKVCGKKMLGDEPVENTSPVQTRCERDALLL